MRLLVDENLSYRVARRLTHADHDAVHVTLTPERVRVRSLPIHQP